MGTRSRIGIVNKDGTVKSIYCHWDGYPSHNGEILMEDYTDPEKVEKLISLGAISILNPEVDPDPRKPHSFDNPQSNVVVAYGRDRGESGVDPRIDKTVEEFCESDIEEYGYLFKDGEWFILKGWVDKKPRKLVKLTKELIDGDDNGDPWWE